MIVENTKAIQFYFKAEGDSTFTLLNEPKNGCWIHLPYATQEKLEKLALLINIPVSELIDSLDPFEIPRLEEHLENVIVYTRHPSEQEVGFYTSTLTLVVTRDYFVTISSEDPPFIYDLIKTVKVSNSTQKSQLLTYMLMKMTQLFTAEIKKIRTIVLKRTKLHTTIDSEEITLLTKHEEILNQYLSSLKPVGAVLEKIKDGKRLAPQLLQRDQILLEDLYYTVAQSEEICSVNLRTIHSLRDSYQIIFTNNLSRTIKLLTALTIILSIPTMIASIYGMNVALPLADSKYAFFFLIILVMVTLVSSLKIFKRKGWL